MKLCNTLAIFHLRCSKNYFCKAFVIGQMRANEGALFSVSCRSMFVTNLPERKSGSFFLAE